MKKKKIFYFALLFFFYFLITKSGVYAGSCEFEENTQNVVEDTCENGYKAQPLSNFTGDDNDNYRCYCGPDSEEAKCEVESSKAWSIELQRCLPNTFLPSLENLEECPSGWGTLTHEEARGLGIINYLDYCSYGSQEETPISPIQPTIRSGIFSAPGGDCMETAIGCIPIEPEAFVKKFLTWAIGIAGGIALLLMLFSAFGILTSAGDPEKLKASQERLTSAIIGLLFIIFSVFLLRIIGTPIMELGGN